MPKDLEKPENMYNLLEGAFMTNPMIDCVYIKDVSTTLIRQYIGPQSSQSVHVIPWSYGGYTVITVPSPKIEVPKEMRGHMDEFLSKCNQRLERGVFVITDDDAILFRTYLACREGDDISLRTVLEEVNLGTRMFMNHMGYIVRAMDGEKFEDIFAEDTERKEPNASDSFTSEELYVPASGKDSAKAIGGMYV